ncbi:hypothetical protein JYU34_016432 [Plutella xylostella]|uniref:Cuticular protein n=1 Tax=Plutella xylostella TaxID=51655 RepID=A0ABQ7Q2L5_PLUXY|nr:hypothetical protein JYU34_016432 [Plutella xylostella]
MLRVISGVLIVVGVVAGQALPLPYGPTAVPLAAAAQAAALGYNPALGGISPAAYPLAPGARPPYPGLPVPGVAGVPAVPGVNPYYNYNGVGGPVVPILTYSNEVPTGTGTYAFSFSTGDGKQAQESGFLKDAYIDNNGEPQGTQVVQGSYAYIAPDGTPIQVSYVADENGFRPSGVHIPAGANGIVPNILTGNYTRPYDPAFNRFNPYRPGAPLTAPIVPPFNAPIVPPYNVPGAYNNYRVPLANNYNNLYNRYDPYNPVAPYRPSGLYGAPGKDAKKD